MSFHFFHRLALPQQKRIFRISHLISVITLVLSMILAESASAKNSTNQKIKAATSFTVIADMVRNITGDAAEVISITKPGAGIHNYQPTPKDIVRAQNADIIFWNGLNLELWFGRFLRDIKDVPNIVLTEGLTPLSISSGEYKGKPNPHAWMSTENAPIYIENIRKGLCNVDPANCYAYTKNASNYAQKIKTVRTELESTLSSIPKERRTLVTSEGAFSYLARDLGLKEVYLWPMNAEQQGTPQQVRKVIDTVKNNKVPVVFSESTISDRPMKQVAAETGALYGGVLYVDSLSESSGKVPTYLDLLQVTTQTIARGFERALQKETKE